jgi:hypothetical protein
MSDRMISATGREALPEQPNTTEPTLISAMANIAGLSVPKKDKDPKMLEQSGTTSGTATYKPGQDKVDALLSKAKGQSAYCSLGLWVLPSPFPLCVCVCFYSVQSGCDVACVVL